MTQTADALLGAPAQYLSSRNLSDAGRVTYVLHQRFRYTYDAPARDLDHRLVVVPPQRHCDQRRRAHSVTVSAEGARITNRRDSAGNRGGISQAERGAGVAPGSFFGRADREVR